MIDQHSLRPPPRSWTGYEPLQARENPQHLQRAAAAIGIALQMASAGSAFAVETSNLIGATVPGVPTTTYTRPNDSTTGVTQATSANTAMQCGAGLVLSGGSCVPLASLVPPPSSCPYGQVMSGGSCIPLPSPPPPGIQCPTGFVLSGGSCVPLVTSTPTCAAQPATTQYVPCPTGQTGGITQSRTGTCNSSTGYVWSMSTWSTTSSTCAWNPPPPPPPPPPAPAACTTQNVSWGAWLGVGSACTGVLYSVPSGSASTANNAAGGFAGTQTYVCSAGNWTLQSQDCRSTTPPPAPPPQCGPVSGSFSWGTNCSGYINAPTTNVGGTYTVYGSDGRGYYSWSCAAGGNWFDGGQNYCPPPAPQPPPPSGCGSISHSADSDRGVCVFNFPSTPSGQASDVSDAYQGWSGGQWRAVCWNGNWILNGGAPNGAYAGGICY